MTAEGNSGEGSSKELPLTSFTSAQLQVSIKILLPFEQKPQVNKAPKASDTRATRSFFHADLSGISLISNMQTFPEHWKRHSLCFFWSLYKSSWAENPGSPRYWDQVLLHCRVEALPSLQIQVNGMRQRDLATSQRAEPSRQKKKKKKCMTRSSASKAGFPGTFFTKKKCLPLSPQINKPDSQLPSLLVLPAGPVQATPMASLTSPNFCIPPPPPGVLVSGA